jgi:hypothetical protein
MGNVQHPSMTPSEPVVDLLTPPYPKMGWQAVKHTRYFYMCFSIGLSIVHQLDFVNFALVKNNWDFGQLNHQGTNQHDNY